MKTVVKGLVNRAGLPTDSLVCALTTRLGSGGSAGAELGREEAAGDASTWRTAAAIPRLLISPHPKKDLGPLGGSLNDACECTYIWRTHTGFAGSY